MQQMASLVKPDIGFDVASWRALLFEVAKRSGEDIQAISPFGFEILRDRSFLARRLSNFFVYVGTSSRDSKKKLEEICRSFTEHLVSELMASYVDFLREVRLISTPFFKIECERSGKRTIYVKCFPCHGSLLNDYAIYMIACIGGIVGGQIKAAIEFDRDPRSRRYLFQLCIIHDALFRDVGGGLSSSARNDLMDLIRQLHSAELQGLSRIDSGPSDMELKVLHNLVLPYFRDLCEVVRETRSSMDCAVDIRSRDFHGQNWLTLNISKELLTEKVEYVVRSYEMLAWPTSGATST